jgi:phage tail-like protein
VAELRFGVEIEGIVVGWFTECSGLSIEREVHPYTEGGLGAYVHQLPGRVKSADITLKRGLADRALWQWFRQGLHDLQVERRNVSVILYGVDQAESDRWDLTAAFPLKWSGPDLKADNTQVAVEALTIGQGGHAALDRVQRATETGRSGAEPLGATGADQAVDLAALAGKVYDLLKQELRWERERSG